MRSQGSATCEPVLSVLRRNQDQAKYNVSRVGPLPAHVRELFHIAATSLVPQQKDALSYDFPNIFSQDLQICLNIGSIPAMLHHSDEHQEDYHFLKGKRLTEPSKRYTSKA